MSTKLTQNKPAKATGTQLLFLGCSGLVLAGIIAHAQYGILVGEVQVIVFIPIILSLILVHATSLQQRIVERGMRTKLLRPSFGRGGSSRFWFNSYEAEVATKAWLFTNGLFAGIYFLCSLVLLAAPHVITFVLSINAAGLVALLYPAFKEDRQVIKKK